MSYRRLTQWWTNGKDGQVVPEAKYGTSQPDKALPGFKTRQISVAYLEALSQDKTPDHNNLKRGISQVEPDLALTPQTLIQNRALQRPIWKRTPK